MPSISGVVQFALALLVVGGLSLVVCVGEVRAATDNQVGADGVDGVPGAAGDPGQPGGDGTAGQSATAFANTDAEANVAIATGGDGGSGGRGGAGAVSGADGGSGGSGANGGDATATASSFLHGSARAIATGGSGGFLGSGGLGSSPGVNGDSGAFGGQMGDAIATASVLRNSGGLGPTGGMDVEATASGTNASATVSGAALGMGLATSSQLVEATATAVHGNSLADATGTTTHGALRVQATAETSGMGDPTRTVNATATGIQTGAGSLSVGASVGFASTTEAAEGISTVSASGMATAGADVTVSAGIRGGRDADVRNAVSGSTSGRLSLIQGAHTSFLPSGIASNFFGEGVTRTSLVAENPGGGDLDVSVFATSILRRPSISDPGDGDVILGDVHGTSTTGADVDVSATARGYRLFQERLDQPGTPSQIRGQSNGGDVSVAADFTSGRMFRSRNLGTLVGDQFIGNTAPSLEMDNAIWGDTTGNLVLTQDGRGSNGANVDLLTGGMNQPPLGTVGVGGDGSDVTNRLTRAGSFASLSMNATSSAGSGGLSTRDGIGGQGGSATTILEGTNDSGGVTLIGNALGRDGGDSDGPTGAGGDATLDFRATTTGDGHSILIGNERENQIIRPPFTLVTHGARAANAGSGIRFFGTPTAFGRAGNAHSRSDGSALGDSQVEVYDYAEGGDSDFGGGAAVSSARAQGGGVSAVVAQSKARGGRGSFTELGSVGGDATSSAFASGLGDASARAETVAGFGFGANTAHAAVELTGGSSGTATIEAVSSGGAAGDFRAMVLRTMSGLADFEVVAGNGLALPTIPPANTGSAFVTGQPLGADVDRFTSGHQGLNTLMDATPDARVEALGQWSAEGGASGSNTQFIELDITLFEPNSMDDVAIAFSVLDASGGGFDELHFRLEVLGDLFGTEMIFTDLGEATTFFSSLIFLGQAYMENVPRFGTPAIHAVFEVTTSLGQSIAVGVGAVVVPEPSTAFLLGFGLLYFASSKMAEGHRRR